MAEVTEKTEEKEEKEETVYGLESNVAAAISYLGGFVTGLIFYFADEENEFVRFHALQSILLSIPLFILSFIWSVFWTSFLYPTPWYYGSYFLIRWISRLFWILTWILLLFLMSKAYNGKKFKLPVIGGIAEKNA